MNVDAEERNRNVIPRWRDFRTTLALGELNSSSGIEPRTIILEGSLDEQITDWQNNRSLAFATDLVGSGLVIGRSEEIEEAADFILSARSHATDLQRRVAKQAKDPNLFAQLSHSKELITSSSDELISCSQKRVRSHRAQLQNAPRNPIRLVELSREYATLGSIKKALRAMDTAVSLAPANRFVLRSAVRLYVHAKEFDKAHYVLRRAPSLRSDPWLLSAEIAVSMRRDVTSGHVGTAMRQISDDNHAAFDVSELASALATLEMHNANGKLARKLFRQALRNPTENSVAQAEWASRSMQNLSVEVLQYNTPRKFEALGWSQFKHGVWDKALDQGKKWIFDQPFAVSPIVFTGMVATVVEDFDMGEQIFKFGLNANPENVILKNNLAFTLASNNKPQEAESEIESINRSSLTVVERVTTTATEGLIKFRSGLKDEGRELYRRAIEIARENKEPSYAMRALVFLAREEIHARTDFAKQTLEKAEKEYQGFASSEELNVLLNRLKADVQFNST